MTFASRTLAQCVCLALLACASLAGAQKPDAPAKPETPAAPPEILQGLPQGTYAYFQTNHGEIVVKLFIAERPKATDNFIGLAEGTKTFLDLKTMQPTKRPFYDGLIFHRIIDGFMIQGGDPQGTGMGGPGYKFKDEMAPPMKFDRPGLLAYANSGPNTNGCQFFITVAPVPSLDPPRQQFTIFGEVVKGMDIVYKIAKVPCDQSDPQSPKPLQPVVMGKVRIYNVGADGKAAEAKNGAAKPAPAGK